MWAVSFLKRGWGMSHLFIILCHNFYGLHLVIDVISVQGWSTQIYVTLFKLQCYCCVLVLADEFVVLGIFIHLPHIGHMTVMNVNWKWEFPLIFIEEQGFLSVKWVFQWFCCCWRWCSLTPFMGRDYHLTPCLSSWLVWHQPVCKRQNQPCVHWQLGRHNDLFIIPFWFH